MLLNSRIKEILKKGIALSIAPISCTILTSCNIVGKVEIEDNKSLNEKINYEYIEDTCMNKTLLESNEIIFDELKNNKKTKYYDSKILCNEAMSTTFYNAVKQGLHQFNIMERKYLNDEAKEMAKLFDKYLKSFDESNAYNVVMNAIEIVKKIDNFEDLLNKHLGEKINLDKKLIFDNESILQNLYTFSKDKNNHIKTEYNIEYIKNYFLFYMYDYSIDIINDNYHLETKNKKTYIEEESNNIKEQDFFMDENGIFWSKK